MDSHHEQVRQAVAAAGEGTRLYFAYSTILDRKAFEEWRTQHRYEGFDLPAGELAEAADLDVVFDFPSRFWGGRVAGLEDRPGASVFGKLFEISEKDWPIVQHKEGVISGTCVEREVRVRVGGEERRATAFVTSPGRRSQEGAVSAPFVEALLAGARSAGLPESWLTRISAAAK